MSQPTACCRALSPTTTTSTASVPCVRCDLLVGLDGYSVIDVVRDDETGRLRVTVESGSALLGCPGCGVIACSRGRREVRLIDIPAFAAPVDLVWRKRLGRCAEPLCEVGSFTETDPGLAPPRGLLTTRARWWGIAQIRREGASVQGIARQLGTTWRTVWSAIEPLLEAMAADPARFTGVATLGVDEHVWHHVSTKPVESGGRGPKELTGMVDLTRDQHGRVHARLLDLVPGRSGTAYAAWLDERGVEFKKGVQVATLDPFQ